MMRNQPLALIIEDEVDLADIFTSALQAAGLETETITDGEAALARLADIVPDVVVLDLHLPGVDGTQIFNYIRSAARFDETRVIIASADAGLAQTLDADLVLLKPITFFFIRSLIILSSPTKAPPVMKRIFLVSIFKNS